MNWLRTTMAMLAVIGLVGGAAAPAAAGVATDQLRGAVERVLKTLEDPAFKGEGKLAERRVAVRKIANEIFDFGEIAKRSMARHWQPLSEAQRNEFVGLFADLLERSYISKIETYGGEKIQYTAERADGDFATVSTKIITKNGTEVPVDYRMVKRADRWLVYDVSIEGVSLVSNYRTQFNKIIQTSSYNELVNKLKNKQDELLAEDKGQKKKL
jgi:phospholipid transport system substrate-binding protein